MDIGKLMNEIVEDLQKNAIPYESFVYDVKATHQIIRKYLEALKQGESLPLDSSTLCDLDGKEVMVKFKVTKHIPKIIIEDI